MKDIRLEVAMEDIQTGALLDALPRAIFVTSPDGVILAWNAPSEALYGWRSDEVVGKTVSDLLPASLQSGQPGTVLGAEAPWQGETTTIHRSGEPLHIWVSNRPVLDDAGTCVAVVTAADEATEHQRLLEMRSAELSEHLRLAIEAGGLGTFRWDMASGATTWDERLEALFGLPPGSFEGTFDAWASLLHPEDRDRVLATVERAVASGERYIVEHRVVWPDGSTHWLQGSGQVTTDLDGNVTGTIGCTRDVTQEVLAELDRGRRTAEAVASAALERIHRERLEFLSSVNDAVAAATDRRGVMINVTRAAVPRLGDWCSIYVLPQPGATIPEIETAHGDPALVARAQELHERVPYDPDAPTGMPRVIRTGAAEFHPEVDDALIEELAGSERERALLRDVEPASYMGVPLVKRGHVVGGLQLIMSKENRGYTHEDFALAQAVAARIASTLENLRLSAEQRSIAATLQASLLPLELPDIPGVELAVRYWANGEGVDVGGDFYDLFPLAGDTWAVAIGDVCGTGPAAAAVTGMARHTIATAAWHGDDPATVMAHLNQAMRRRRVGSFCTALYGTLRQTSAGVAFTFASGGHPLPIVARRSGQTTPVGEPGTLLGLLDAVTTTTTTTHLEPGDSIVLYTDGVTDVAPPHGLTTEQLVDRVREAAEKTATAQELADQLHADLSAILPIAQRRDDIALLVLRIPLDAPGRLSG